MATDVGSVYRTALTVRDATGALVNPATKTLAVYKPDQTADVPPTIQTLGTGLFYADYVMPSEGLFRFAWATTSPVVSQTDYENAILYRSVVGLDEMRDFLNVIDTSRDEIMRGMMMAATELAEKTVGTCVPRTITNERIPGTARAAIRLPSAPVMPSTAITIQSVWPGGPSWTESILAVSYESGVIEPLDYIGFWYGPWNATYTAGRLVIPARVTLAVKEIVYDLWATQRMVGADQLEPGLDETSRYEYSVPPGYVMPPHAKAMLESEALPGFA